MLLIVNMVSMFINFVLSVFLALFKFIFKLGVYLLGLLFSLSSFVLSSLWVLIKAVDFIGITDILGFEDKPKKKRRIIEEYEDSTEE